MPQPKNVKESFSLKEACLDNIAIHMTNFWCKHHCKKAGSIYEDGPFECMPGSLLDEIIETLKRKELLRLSHWSLLITSHLERLYFSDVTNEEPIPYDLIAFRCKDTLKELRIFECKIAPETLFNMIKLLRKLEVLELRRTDIHGDVLANLGSCCPELRELDLHGSWTVTDEVIQYLFMDNLPHNEQNRQSHIMNVEERGGKCKMITSLNLRDTSVGASGVEIALKHLPNLQHLNHPEVVSVLGRMHLADWEPGAVSIPPYHLKSLFAGNNYSEKVFELNELDRLHLSVAIDICPFVTEVHLIIDRRGECPDDALSPLCKLKNLKFLEIGVHTSPAHIVCFSAVVPVLQSCGQSMTTLKLSYIHGVDIGVIGMHCPLLEDLWISADKGYDDSSVGLLSASSPPGRPFSRLKSLHIDSYRSWVVCFGFRGPVQERRHYPQDLPPSHLKDLLSSPLLETVCIRKSSVLTDGLLKEVLKKGQQFSQLREIKLSQCYDLTVDFLHSLLQTSGPLTHITTEYCHKVTVLDVDSLRSLADRNNWDLRIDHR